MKKIGLVFLLCVVQNIWGEEPAKKIPLINTTDLYFPGQDIGDNFDIIAAYALEEIDLRAVIFDVTQDYRLENGVGRDMGIIPVTQLNYIFDRTVPAAPSPFTRMRSTTGDPDLLRKKVNLLHLSIGASAPVDVEWNVALNPHAFVTVLRSGLPIALYPCGAGNLNGGIAAFSYDSNNGYWQLANLNFISQMDSPIRRYLEFAFSRSKRADFLRAMETDIDPPLTKHYLPCILDLKLKSDEHRYKKSLTQSKIEKTEIY